jgi:NodT family efflux transporter outer membrane factor (OMF) lipoprotein
MNPCRARLSLVLMLLTGCSLAPPYQRPDTGPAPKAFKEGGLWALAQPADSMPRGPWWESFHDTELSLLETRVSSANPDIKAAFARMQEARAAARSNRADYFPTLSATGSPTTDRDSLNKPYFPSTDNPRYHDDVLGVDLSYELDVWGRIRNEVSAGNALSAASAADLATLDLSTHAELATDYFALRGADAEQDLLDATVAVYQQAQELTHDLYVGGGASEADMALAQLQLQNAITQATDIRIRRAQLEHAIAVLVGQSASTFTITSVKDFAPTPPSLAVGLPSTLLERRPDIASAERRVAAANADIGIARAAFFPVFGLGAVAGYESTSIANWITAPSLFWSIGPTAALTLFDGGRRHALSDAARAAYDEAAANYRHSVLVAYQEVEDNLAALRDLEQEAHSTTAAHTAAQHALIQANHRYEGGIASYFDVVTAQNAALQSQLATTDVQVRRMEASVLLVKALGGGWQAPARNAAALAMQTATTEDRSQK